MNIIDCHWEKENLGLETKEVIFKSDTDLDSFRSKFIETEYNVLKVPVQSNISTSSIKDYNFIENQISYSLNLKNFVESKLILRMLSQLSVQRVLDCDEVFCKLDESLFDTDRISIDEKLGPSIALKRYKNWMQSLVSNNKAELFEIIYDEQAIGFFCFSEDGRDMSAILGGLYTKWKALGFGLSIILCPIKIAQERGVKSISTKISSNNFNVLKLYDYLNFKVTSMHYVFTKHNKG